jgi:hypothetical protein
MKRRPKTAWIQCKVAPEEKAQFKRLADARHTDLSELIRQLLHREVDSQKVQAA